MDSATPLGVVLLALSLTLSGIAICGTQSASPSAPQVTHLHLQGLSHSPRSTTGPLCTDCVVSNISVGSEPQSLVFDSGKGETFAENLASNNVSVIDDATDKVVANIPVGLEPLGGTYDRGMGEVFIADSGSGNLSVINDTTDTVVATVPVGPSPSEATYDSATGEVFVANGQNVTVVSDTTNTVKTTIHLRSAVDVAYDSGNGDVYVTTDGNISVVSGATNTVVATIPSSWSTAEAYDSAKGEVYVLVLSGIEVIDDWNNTVVANISAPLLSSVGLDWLSDVVYDEGLGELSVILTGDVRCAHGSMILINDTTNTVVAYFPIGYNSVPPLGGMTYDWRTSEDMVPSYCGSIVTVVLPGERTLPVLSSVTLSPSSASVPSGGTLTFTANSSCTGGQCPSYNLGFGEDYAWELSDELGKILVAPAEGSVATFTAGCIAGTVILFVTGSLNGRSVRSSANITVATNCSVPRVPTLLGLPVSEAYLLVGVLVAVGAIAVGVLLLRKWIPRTPWESTFPEEPETVRGKGNGGSGKEPSPEKKGT